MPRSPYSVHPAVAYQQAIIANLKAKTGRSLAEWLALAEAKGPKDRKKLSAWLKERGLGGTQAGIVSERLLPSVERHAFLEDTEEGYLQAAEAYVDAMFSGKKAHLRPLYDTLLEIALDLGDDMRACPCKTIVPLYREHVVAEIRPSTLTRVDLGLALGDPALVRDDSDRLIDTGGFEKKDRITHRIEIRSLKEIDFEVETWLKAAYERDVS
ncbi:MAG TPA: DUF5655 domain-containing protein [Holophagaceae bacterium]|nr:DUF5655 domain-containing protein [Holophagaceae bacterium]